MYLGTGSSNGVTGGVTTGTLYFGTGNAVSGKSGSIVVTAGSGDRYVIFLFVFSELLF